MMLAKRYAQQEFIPTLAAFLKCSVEYKNRLVQIINSSSPRNDLFEKFIRPFLYVPELDNYIAVHRTAESSFSHIAAMNAVEELDDDNNNQVEFQFFSNVMGIPVYGPGYKRGSKNYSRGWQPPTERPSIGAYWFFTFECDASGDNAFQNQLNWVWEKDHDKRTALERLDDELRRRYRDYRGYTVVWSGSKSLHIHLVFETTHLSRESVLAISKLQRKSPDHRLRNWTEDIRGDAIWRYHSHKWNELSEIFQSAAMINAVFDPSMQFLHQKRRLPWGFRKSTEGNYHGFPVGEYIPQVVIEEKLNMTAPRGAHEWFLSAAEANQLPPITSRSRHAVAAVTINHAELLDALTDHLRNEWGQDYPKPAWITLQNDEPFIYFYNHPSDQRPSTFVGGTYSSLVFRGQNAPTGVQNVSHLPGKVSAIDLIDALLDGLDGDENVEPTVGATEKGFWRPAERMFIQEASSRNQDGYRKGLHRAVMAATMATPYTVIASVEGAGKSSTILSQAVEYRREEYYNHNGYWPGFRLVNPDNGFHVFACQSYDQCTEQFLQYRNKTGPGGKAVLVKSFSRHYGEELGRLGESAPERISREMAFDRGYPTLLDAVFHEQRSIYDAITSQKNSDWIMANGQCGFRDRFDTILFTAHRLAQDFNRVSKSKAWLHPDFNMSMDVDEWVALAGDFNLYRLIHDEVSIDDLLTVATESEVEFARRVKSLVKDWSKATNPERLKAHRSVKSKIGGGPNFDDCCGFIDADFTDEDRQSVVFDRFPFGKDNTEEGIYRSKNGEAVYIKTRDWWIRCRSRVVITTTEKLPVSIISGLRWPNPMHSVEADGQENSERQAEMAVSSRMLGFNILPLDHDSILPPEHLRMRRDVRASKTRVRELTLELLSEDHGGFDLVITNEVKNSRVMNHATTKGRNDLTDKRIATIITYIGPDHYAELNAIGQKYDIEDIIGLFYRDQINQDVGRNRGFRSVLPTPMDHVLYVSPGLFRELGGRQFFRRGRYQFSLSGS